MPDLNNPDEFRRVLYEGALLLRQNRPQDALEKLLPLYEAAPTNLDVAINLGGAYILLAKWNKATRVLSKAAELHPDNAMIWSNLAAAHLGRLELSGPRQQERAIQAYARALSIDPTAPNVNYHLGLIYKDRRDLEAARAQFEQAVVVDPSDRDAQFWIDWIDRQLEAGNAVESPPSSSGDDAGGELA